MPGLQLKKTLVDGVAIEAPTFEFNIPSTIWAIPRDGDTVNLWVSLDGGTTWEEWSRGAVTAAASDVLTSGITHIKGQRTSGTGIASTFGVC